MTMQSKVSKAVFSGNGATTDFPFDFKVWDTSELSVTITGPDGASIPATGWTATLTDTGGTVTYRKDGAPLPSGWKLAILRDMPFTQPVDLLSGTRFDPQVVEDSMDMACAERQQLLEQLQRAVILPPTSDDTPEDMAQEILRARDEAVNSAGSAKSSEQEAATSASQAADSEQAAATSAEAADQSRAEAAASAAAASQSATAASQSAEAAAESESKAAGSAASILGLHVEVATLDPGLPASGDYDPETGILHLGIPKGDSGASAIATPTSLGSVMPQTGHEDGLELETDGKLRVRKASASQRGGVLASKTAQAGAVPLGGADGKVDKSWVPVILLKSRIVITESNAAWTPPVTGWARVTVIGGGGGGAGGSGDSEAAVGGGGGGSGDRITDYVYLSGNAAVTIGAGGSGGAIGNVGTDGGKSKFTLGNKSFEAYGGKGGGLSLNLPYSLASSGKSGGIWGINGNPGNVDALGASGLGNVGGGGNGGGCAAGYAGYKSGFQHLTAYSATGYGSGGAGGSGGNDLAAVNRKPGSNGASGAVIIEYYDPEKEVA